MNAIDRGATWRCARVAEIGRMLARLEQGGSGRLQRLGGKLDGYVLRQANLEATIRQSVDKVVTKCKSKGKWNSE